MEHYGRQMVADFMMGLFEKIIGVHKRDCGIKGQMKSLFDAVY